MYHKTAAISIGNFGSKRRRFDLPKASQSLAPATGLHHTTQDYSTISISMSRTVRELKLLMANPR
jgi:hypothetical protein